MWLIFAWALAGPAFPEFNLQDTNTLRVVTEAGSIAVPTPCPALAVAVRGDQVFLACGPQGLGVLSFSAPAALRVVEIRDLGGSVVGFHRVGEDLWMEVAFLEARLVSSGLAPARLPTEIVPVVVAPSPAAPAGGLAIGVEPDMADARPPPAMSSGPTPTETAAPGPTPTETAAPTAVGAAKPAGRPAANRVGSVVEVVPEGVVIDLGAEDGLHAGDNVELFAEIRTVIASPDDVATYEQTIAVGTVIAVTANRAMVAVGMNEQVDVGHRARSTSRAVTARRMFRPRPSGIWSLQVSLRPFVGIGALAFGTLSDARITYRASADVAVHALFEPLGFGWGEQTPGWGGTSSGGLIATAGNLIVSYDQTYFSIGLGAGWSSATIGGVRGYGFSLAQWARLGSEDGLNFVVRNIFVLFQDRFEYGSTIGWGQVPLSDSVWLSFGGGGGVSGFFLAEVGLRLALVGNGGHGTWYVRPSAGAGGLFSDGPWTQVFAGPMAGIGVEWRP